MPIRGSTSDLLVDTSVAVALMVTDHEDHERTFQALSGYRLGLAGHAAFETFSVLTRLPPPARRTPAVIARMLEVNFPGSRYLSAQAAEALLARLSDQGIAGGSVYDALVAAVAAEYEMTLVTRDRRALDTYRSFDIDFEVVSSG